MNILEGLNPEQEKAVKHFQGPLLILAGAGSGKTRVLTHRIAFLINEYRVKPWNILALTFTNKAAGEMRERVQSLLAEQADDIWVTLFTQPAVRILRRNIEALGYSRSFTIYDGDDQKTLMREIIKFLNLDPKKYKERTFMTLSPQQKTNLSHLRNTKKWRWATTRKNFMQEHTENMKDGFTMPMHSILMTLSVKRYSFLKKTRIYLNITKTDLST